MKQIFFQVLFKTGVVQLKQRWKPRRPLTILGYHQINTPVYLRETMGWRMTPEKFHAQIQYLVAHYKVLDAKELEGIIAHGLPIPKNAVAITFDDGYSDVYDVALPIMKEFALPSIVFLTTGAMDRQMSIWTNIVYYYFYLTNKTQLSLDLPDGSMTGGKWTNVQEKRQTILHVNQKLKSQAFEDIPKILSVLARALGVNHDASPLEELPMLNWDQVRELHDSGLFTIGSHTVNHPILSRCSPTVQQQELTESRSRIEEEIKHPCTILAYPNGQAADITRETIEIARDAGYSMAFMFSPETPYPDSSFLNAPRHPIMTADLAEFAWLLS
ncbi:polysaccharide deacetylase family protein [bacterium]|nr:polysaccharide deacetylase family protein [bacterium]